MISCPWWVNGDLAAEVWHLKEPQKLPPVLSPEEVKRILSMATSLKARVMLTISYGCGLRAGEVVRLRACDIDSTQMIIRVVQSKGRKDRHVMLPPEVLDLLRQWWKARPTWYDIGVAPEQRWLFPGRNRHQPLTTRQYGRLFKEATKAAGLRKTLSLHSLRHSFATHLLERGKDARVIAALLGHAKPETTSRYTRVAIGMISKIESPLAPSSLPLLALFWGRAERCCRRLMQLPALPLRAPMCDKAGKSYARRPYDAVDRRTSRSAGRSPWRLSR
jgi:integrase/recombinase XerD